MSSVNITVNELNDISSMIVLISSLINIIPGGIGLIFNIFVFIQQPLRHEPCAIYFFWSTFFSLISVWIILPLRVAGAGYNIDPTNYNLGFCKIEYFVLYTVRTISAWLIVLACIDRFFHSSAKVYIRQMSSVKIARIAVSIMSMTITVIHGHILIYYKISINSDRFGNISPLCGPEKGIYSTFYGFWNMVIYSLCPCLLMFLFGLLTLHNIRQYRPIELTHRITRRTDAQLLRMLTAQVFIIVITTLPLCINQLYMSFTSNIIKDTLRIAQENLVTRIVGSITYFAHSTSFYLYTLTGTVFRKEFLKIIKRCCYSNQNKIAPVMLNAD